MNWAIPPGLRSSVPVEPRGNFTQVRYGASCFKRAAVTQLARKKSVGSFITQSSHVGKVGEKPRAMNQRWP